MSVLVPDRHIVPCVADFLPGVEGAAFHPQIFPGLELVYVINGPLALSTEHKTDFWIPRIVHGSMAAPAASTNAMKISLRGR
jgi:hypothetical protein